MNSTTCSPEATAAALDQAVAAATTAITLPPVVDAGEWLTLEQRLAPPALILTGLLDAGSKMLIAGPSKARKSFFVLELAARLAVGSPEFIDIGIPGPRRVLCIQPEIAAAHYQRRLARVVRAILGDDADPRQYLADRMKILNCRGADMWAALARGCLTDLARQHRADVVFVDPVYKLLETGKEDSQDFRGLLAAFDRLTGETGTAVGYVAHYPKGNAGDRNAIDRTAGSGWLARDMDVGIYLDSHSSEPDALVCTTIARNYAPRPDTTIRYNVDTGLFEVLRDVAPEVRTTRGTARHQTTPGAAVGVPESKALALLADGPLPSTEFRKRLGALGTQLAGRAVMDTLLDSGRIVKGERAGSRGVVLVGTPEQLRSVDVSTPRQADSKTTSREA